jgi:hypothetical protein
MKAETLIGNLVPYYPRSLFCYAVAERIEYRSACHIDTREVRCWTVPCGLITTTVPIHTVWRGQGNSAVVMVNYAPPKPYKIFVSRSADDARFQAFLRKHVDRPEAVAQCQSKNYTARELYAISIGVQIPSEGGHFAKKLQKGLKLRGKRLIWIDRTLEEELERRITIAERKQTPKYKNELLACAARKERAAYNDYRRGLNKQAKNQKRQIARLARKHSDGPPA